MTPVFSSWGAFFAMGGYAFYVWTSLLIVISSMLILTIAIYYQNKKSERVVRRKICQKMSILKEDGDTQK